MLQHSLDRISSPSLPGEVRHELVLAMMDRLGVSLAPDEFQYEVARAYETIATGTTPRGLIEPSLRSCHSYPVFQAALRNAGPARNVLILGCGEGLPGLDPEYAAVEWRRIRPDTANVDCAAVSLPSLLDDRFWRTRAYDAVVTHSMVHFVYRLDLLFHRIEQVLRPGGAYVMGKEVNALFGRSPELLGVAAALGRELAAKRRYRGLFNLDRYYKRIGALIGSGAPLSWAEGVNLVLNRRLGARADLTPFEQSRLIEVHRPLLPPSPQQIGMQGMDASWLSANYLSRFELAWFGSSGYLGYHHSRSWSARWKQRNEELAAERPGHGVYLAACWRLRK